MCNNFSPRHNQCMNCRHYNSYSNTCGMSMPCSGPEGYGYYDTGDSSTGTDWLLTLVIVIVFMAAAASGLGLA